MIAMVLNSASSFSSSWGVTNFRWAKRSSSALMAATIGATLPWICDFAVASCGWTLAATFEVVTACVTCVVQPASAVLSLAMTASPAFLTELTSTPFECSSAGWTTAMVLWSSCETMINVVGTAATVSTLTAVMVMIRSLIHVVRIVNITLGLLEDPLLWKDERGIKAGHRRWTSAVTGLYRGGQEARPHRRWPVTRRRPAGAGFVLTPKLERGYTSAQYGLQAEGVQSSCRRSRFARTNLLRPPSAASTRRSSRTVFSRKSAGVSTTKSPA